MLGDDLEKCARFDPDGCSGKILPHCLQSKSPEARVGAMKPPPHRGQVASQDEVPGP